MESNERFPFGSDRVLLFDKAPWNAYGYGVANFGNNIGTRSMAIHNLADEIGQVQLRLMTDIDAQRTQPPSRNTLERMCKLLNRVNSIFRGRLKKYNDRRLEEGHATGVVRTWSIHPAPYFHSPVVRNRWLKEYNDLCMIALTNIYQHSDNRLALTITEQFAQEIWTYFAEVKMLLATELLELPRETVEADGFVFLTEHYDAYDPMKFVGNHERLDTPGPVYSQPTEDDLRPLFDGIPATTIIPFLKQYPIGEDYYGYSGEALPPGAGAVGTQDGSATAEAGGEIGKPQL